MDGNHWQEGCAMGFVNRWMVRWFVAWVALWCGGCALEKGVEQATIVVETQPPPNHPVPPVDSEPCSGVDVPDFHRVYLPGGEPVLLFRDDMEDAAVWDSLASDGVKHQLETVDGEDGQAMALSYEIPTDGNWTSSVGWCVALRKIDPAIPPDNLRLTFNVRSSNPQHLLDVKLVDVDGAMFVRQMAMSTNWRDWREFVLRPEDFRHTWGGTNGPMAAVQRIEFAVNGNVRGGEGEVVIDSVRIEQDMNGYAELALSQVGFHPGDQKRAVLRMVSPRRFADPVFSVINAEDGRVVCAETFDAIDFDRWRGTYFIGDFSEVTTPGRYRLSVEWGGQTLQSAPFEIGDKVLTRRVTPAVLSFLRCMQCGDKCHPNDPIIGGYHDTFFDIGNRMWSLVHIILGLSMVVESGEVGDLNQNRVDDAMDELLFALRFAFQVQLDNGGVGAAGLGHDVPPGELVDTWAFLPEEDTIPRVLDRQAAPHTTAFYLGALCRAYPLLVDDYPVVAQETMAHIRRAANYILQNNRRFSTSYEQGAFIYAMTELYKLTGNRKWLKPVPAHVRDLLKLQDLDASNKEIPVCGNFYCADYDRAFTYQYKFIEYNLAILLGLANVAEIFEPSSATRLHADYMLRVFLDCYMKPMASLTPYGQMALGMEREGDGYRVAFFSPWDHPWVGAHGLNCDHFGYGLVAMRMGRLFDDLVCETLADNQMQWVLGQNPLRYCMVSRVGWNNPMVWSVMHGKGGPYDGGIPNGLVGDQCDFPQWMVIFSSGEYWLPHNALYLILSAILDAPGTLAGQLTGRVHTEGDQQVEIYQGTDLIATAPLDSKGRFGPLALPPQQTYTLRYTHNGQWASTDFVLLSGEKKEVSVNVDAAIDIQMECVARRGDEAEVEIRLENRCARSINTKLLIRVFDGEKATKEEESVTIPVNETVILHKTWRVNGKRPLLVAIGDVGMVICPARGEK
ncbi:MAG: hypothetical protein EOM20_07980 [Spartobacteria bacterium]|nr:hypothetical protein [Spartobacteria bacterium]